MLNIKGLSIIASLLLLVGIVGSLITYQLIQKPKAVTQEFTIQDDNFTSIDINADDGQVELVPTDGSKAFIEASGHDIKNDVSAMVKDSSLVIVLKKKKQKLISVNFGLKPTILKVHIPHKDYDSLRIQSDNGTVDVRDVNADYMTLESDNGKVKATSLTNTTLKVQSNNGLIALKDTSADSISVRSDNGKTKLEDVKGKLTVQANNGRIEVKTDSLDDPTELITDNGRIDIQMANTPTNATIIAEATNGNSKIFDEKKSHAIFGTGEIPIVLSSKNGNITVGKR
ncbi:DUF4097 family beta strand repeat-containing protein [Sporosarcina newyorkensis]|uniref:Putative adhesin n=1 Tax=Sporosarcina newyorkensis TaxID=759851 RepID=A0A1T4YID2_9BACL|nr:DUF4097 family beta strand repeat-containing protein [Sporosarcina newyorkensis]SKB01430.1 Putative adhesin [Sporosarcina newyorkensis]